jgi:uncharacterized damage-inducible protein DinB
LASEVEGCTVNLADYLRRQFAYDEWANREALTAVRASTAGRERSLELSAHILAAERLWLERLKEQPASTPVWPRSGLEQCEAEAAELARLWKEYLDPLTAGDASQSISYKNSKGETWTSTILDILTHVILHSAYHRGQIASHLRASGETPAYTDFIHAVRQEFIK